MKTIKSDSDSDSDEQNKVARFSGKNRGVTPSVAARVSPTLVTLLHTIHTAENCMEMWTVLKLM